MKRPNAKHFRGVHCSSRTDAKCAGCRKGLVWTWTSFRSSSRDRKVWKRRREAYRRESKKIAIRCVDCLHPFCPRCARKHFAPIAKVEKRVERELEKLAVKAMRGIGRVCK